MKIHDHNRGDNDPRILEGERLFLQVLLDSPDGTATLAQATPPEFLNKPFPGGGKWRGSIPSRLAGRGIIGAVVPARAGPDSPVCAVRSPRRSRNGGIATKWKLLDAHLARKRLRDLDALLADMQVGSSKRPGLFDPVEDDPFA